MAAPPSPKLARPLPQIGALPMRKVDGRLEVCLLTTRETGRWSVPKGWPMKGISDRRAAAIEARQEAGVSGKTTRKPLGTFDYWKRRPSRFDLVRVTLYGLEVQKVLLDWKEKGQRHVLWMSLEDAATAVDDPGLEMLLRDLASKTAG